MHNVETHNLGIDTHYFNIETTTLEGIRDILVYVEENIGSGSVHGYTSRKSVLSRLTVPLEELDIARLPRDRYIPETLVEMYLTNNSFVIKESNRVGIRYTVYRDRGMFYVKFKFFGLIQYDDIGDISELSLYRRKIYDKILTYIDDNNMRIKHDRLEVCVDLTNVDYFTLDLIGYNGRYREWSKLEVKDRNRYSRERAMIDGVFVKDMALNTNHVIVNMYDKGFKNKLDINLVRIEYKLLKRGIEKLTRDNGSIDLIELVNLLRRYRVLKFSTPRNARRVLKDYVYNINHDKDGNEVHVNTYYKKRAKHLPRLNKYIIDGMWLRDVEDVVLDHLYI